MPNNFHIGLGQRFLSWPANESSCNFPAKHSLCFSHAAELFGRDSPRPTNDCGTPALRGQADLRRPNFVGLATFSTPHRCDQIMMSRQLSKSACQAYNCVLWTPPYAFRTWPSEPCIPWIPEDTFADGVLRTLRN